MRGVTELIIAIILLIVGIIIVVTIYGMFNYFSNPATVASPKPKTSVDNFNYTTYLLDKNPVDLSNYDECKNLMNAIKNAIVNKNPSQVDEISYGTADEFDQASEIQFPFIGDCPAYDGKEILSYVSPGLEQKVCTFRIINLNDLQGSGAPYGGISHATNLYYDDCSYIPSIPNLVISGDAGPAESLSHPFTTANLYYSPDYLYIRNGQFLHYPNLNDPAQFSNAYNGPGRLKIYVGNAKIDNGNCNFNIYLCPRPAIAKSTDEDTISVFNIFRNLETFDLLVFPYYIRDLTGLAFDTNGFPANSKKVYYWNYYEISLSKDYKVETIINAIKEGLYVNIVGKNYSFAHPHWDISIDPTINKNSECWNPSYNNMITSNSEADRTLSIRFNCGAANVCNGNLIIKIAIRRDFKDINNNGILENNEKYVSGIISFCNQ